MKFPYLLTTCFFLLTNCLFSAKAAPGLVENLYALPNGAFIQNESGDEEIILEDVSGSISALQTAIEEARKDYPNAFLMIRLKPGGVYSVSSSPLILGSKMCLTGNASLIEAASSSVAAYTLVRITPGSSLVSISNVILNGRSAAVRGIYGAGVSRVNIDNTSVRNTGRVGIFLQGPGITDFDNQLTVANCDVSGSPENSGIYLKDAAQAVCIENISDSSMTGILLEGVSRGTVANNRCIGNSIAGIALSGNSTATNVFNNFVSGSPTAISLDDSTVRNTIASNEIRSATTGIALSGVVHTLYENVFPSGVTSPVQAATTGHNIVTTAAGVETTGQNYFYPPTILNNHSSTVIAGKSNTNVTTAAASFSQVQAAYDTARAANPANTIVLRLTAPVITGDATLSLSSNTSVVISGSVNLAPGVAGFTSTNSTFVSISGGIIDGGNSTGRQGIKFTGCSRVLIDRVTLQNFGDKNTRVTDSDLIRFSKGGAACIVAYCTLNGGAARGIWTVDSTARFLFSENTIANVNMDGIDIDAFTNSALVKFNTLSGCVRNGIFVEEGAKHNQVVGNKLLSNSIAINLFAYDIDGTAYNSIIANTCTSNGRGIRTGAKSTMSTEHNFIFGNQVTLTAPQSALDAQPSGPENYFSQNFLALNTDDIGSTSAIFFNSPALKRSTAPVVSESNPQGLNGTFFQHQITASHSPTRYTVVAGSMPLGLSLNATTGMISGTPLKPGTFPIDITASNLLGTSSPGTIQIFIGSNASVPKPVFTSAANASGKFGTALTHQIRTTNSPTFFFGTSLPSGLRIDSKTGLISGTPLVDGTFTSEIHAANAGGTTTQNLTFIIASVLPQITSSGLAKAQVGVAFKYQIIALNLPKSYGAASLPAGFTVNATNGEISGVPTTAGNATFTISASNGGGTASRTVSLTILPQAPVITSVATSNGTFGTAFSRQITATNSPTQYTATGLPTGLTINAKTGLISGTPVADGTFAAKVSAINSGGTGNQTLTILIAAIPPKITSIATARAQVGKSFSYRITASNLPKSFAASNLPSGLTVNATSGEITGVPTTAGNATFTISASNGAGTASLSISLTILPPAPVITSVATSNGTFGTAFTRQITATNSPTQYAATGLPTGLTINAKTGLISGTPAVDGTFAAKVSATNSGGTGNQTLSIIIASIPPKITSIATATAQVGKSFSYRITASNLPKSFAALSLPKGLTVNAKTGDITGVPTIAGNATVTISVSNGAGTATSTLSINILPPTPVITNPTSSAASLTKSFSYQVTATNSPTRYTATGLPTGLAINSLTGLISGTPTSIGTYSLTITASNTGGISTQKHMLRITAL